jgi:hemoglobin-like flavoprotein
MPTPDAINHVNLSYGRCSMSPGFFDSFYDIFLKSSPDVAPMFANTDFSKQKVLIKSGISFVIMYAKDQQGAFAKAKLDFIGEVHDHVHRNVKANMYPLWIDSLLKAVQKHDPEYTPQLDKEWREVIKPAIDLLLSHY